MSGIKPDNLARLPFQMNTASTPSDSNAASAAVQPPKIIGELINNAYARARRAWEARDVSGF